MGFFSTKKGGEAISTESPVIHATVHTMETDLKNAIEPRKEDHSQDSGKPEELTYASHSESPFVQESPTPPEPAPIPSKPEEAPILPEAVPKETTKPKKTISMTQGAPLFPHAPLNLPSFKKIEDEALKANAPIQALEEEQTVLRTGTWPKEVSQSEPSPPTPHKSSGKIKKSSPKSALPENIILTDPWGWKSKLAGMVIILIIIAGASYFWVTRKTSDMSLPTIPIPDISLNPSAEKSQEETERNLPFSENNPNPFPVDVETETVSTLRASLMQNAQTMKSAGMTSPVPFVVVDKTNTPIAFFIFASVFNLGLSDDLLNSLGNDFTLFLALDDGNPRLILAIPVKNRSETETSLPKSEKTFPVSLKNLLLSEDIPAGSPVLFSENTYRNIPLRYFNFSSSIPLSFDYALVNDTLVIGTSKNSTRLIIDRLLNQRK